MSAKFIVDTEGGPIEFEIFGDGHVDTASYDLTYDETIFTLGGEKSDVLEKCEYFNNEPAMAFLHMGLKFSQMLKIANAWASDFFERFSDKFEETISNANVEYPPRQVGSMRSLLIDLSKVRHGQKEPEVQWIYDCKESMFKNAARLESCKTSFMPPMGTSMLAFAYSYSALGHSCHLSWVHSKSLDDIEFANFEYDASYNMGWSLIARGFWFAARSMSNVKWPVDDEHARQVNIALQVLGMED